MSQTGDKPTSRPDERVRGVTNILKAYEGQPVFSTFYDEDLESVASQYPNGAHMCDTNPTENHKSIYIMMKGAALSLFTRKGADYNTYKEERDLLHTWYNSADMKGRQWAQWQSMRLSHAMH